MHGQERDGGLVVKVRGRESNDDEEEKERELDPRENHTLWNEILRTVNYTSVN